MNGKDLARFLAEREYARKRVARILANHKKAQEMTAPKIPKVEKEPGKS